MKMKTIEEKAKRYDGAIEKMQSMMKSWETLSYNGKTFLQDIKYIFPELKETEDERIRKQLLKHLREVASGKSLELSTTDYERWATWVAKQGEKGINGKNREIPFSEQKPIERNIWKDTKKELPKADSLILAIDDLGVIRSEYYEGDGYLSKDENIKLSTHHTKWCYQSEAKEIKQPVEWSEEDDDNLSWLAEMLLGFDGNDIECYKDKKFIDKCKEVCKWLKTIKDRVQPQPKQEWGEEDEKYLIYNIEQDYRDKLNNNPSESLRPYYNKVISWLKFLRHQKQWKPSDEQMYILNWITNLLNDGMVEKHAKGILESLYNDLKKLKA